jgi:hypothetical protein
VLDGLRSRAGLAVVALVLASVALRAWASRGVPTPWIAPDEMVYGLLGQSLYREGQLAILGGPTPFYSAVVPAVVGLPLSVADLVLGHTLLKVVQALLMSLAAVPVYLWGKTMMGRGWAGVAAALTLALPGLAYSGLVMTEVVFYPVFVLAAWAMAASLAEPRWTRQALFVAALCLALATRLQAVVLVPAFLTALVLDALLRRSAARLVRFWPSLAAIALLVGAWITWRHSRDESLLAGYEGAGGTYDVGTAARFVGYHVGDLALLTGIFPLSALLLLLWHALRGGEDDDRVRGYLAVAVGVSVWLVVQVGVFASRELGLLAERNLIACAPVLFLGFALWLDRGGPGGYVARALVGLGVAAAVLALPLNELVVPDALPHAFTLIPLADLRDATSLGVLELVIALAVGAAVVLLAVVPRRALVVLPAILLLALAAASVSASREVAAQARAQQLRLLGPERRWIDGAADGPVAYVYDGQAYWNAVWENLFWNRRLEWVYDLPGTLVPGPLPQSTLGVEPDGELRPDGETAPARYAVVPASFALRGERIAEAPQFGTDRQGLALWRIEPPLRLSTITSGLFPNGDVDRVAALTAYDCDRGTFDAVLLVKEPQTVRVFLDGKPVRAETFSASETWDLQVPVGGTGGKRTCKLKIVSNGLLGTTRFEFVRPDPAPPSRRS